MWEQFIYSNMSSYINWAQWNDNRCSWNVFVVTKPTCSQENMSILNLYSAFVRLGKRFFKLMFVKTMSCFVDKITQNEHEISINVHVPDISQNLCDCHSSFECIWHCIIRFCFELQHHYQYIAVDIYDNFVKWI